MISRITATDPQQKAFTSENRPDAAPDQRLAAIESKTAEIQDTVEISKDARQRKTDEDSARNGGEKELSEAQKRQVNQLKKRDQEVRAHERAHIAAGGGLVQGGASYAFQKGPDGKSYAVGGEVKIDTSGERDPDQTIRKMAQVRRAALAPAQPSGTDRAVAARATQNEIQARMEKVQERGTEIEAKSDESMPVSDSQQPASSDAAGPNPYARPADHADAIGSRIDISA